MTNNGPEVLKWGVFDLYACVPEDWDQKRIEEFSNEQVECGTDKGWTVVEDGDQHLEGRPARTPCEKKPGYMHVTLAA